jgi:hypothetical protein
MDESNEHWNVVSADLLLLRRLLSGDRKAEAIFDEFVDHNELELALHTICDFLLENEQVAIKNSDFIVIETLHEQMQIRDGCVDAIRQHRNRRS